jgi:hypothetical protein
VGPVMSTMIRLYLRGGQVVAKSVTDWKVRKNTLENEITELSWESEDGSRMPFIRLDAIDAITVHETVRRRARNE